MSYLLFDIFYQPISFSSYESHTPPNLLLDTIPRQLLFTWLPAICSCYAMKMQYSLFAAITVATGLYTPQDWPPIMGHLADVSTVRDLWGKFWHQLIRRVSCPCQFLEHLADNGNRN